MGGRLIAAGTLEQLAEIPGAFTGRYLQGVLENGRHPIKEAAAVELIWQNDIPPVLR